MIQKVLMFKHANICYDSLNAFSDLVIEQFDNLGIEHEFVDITKGSETIIQEMNEKIDDSFDAALAFNAAGQHNAMSEGVNIFDKFGIPFYNWVVDHPIGMLHSLSSNCKDYHLICMDRKHAEYVKSHFGDIKSVHFLPLGGLYPRHSITEIKDRKYDIAFPGGFPAGTLGERLERYKEYQSPAKEILFNLIDCSLNSRNLDITDVLDVVLHDMFGIDHIEGDDYLPFLSLADLANNFLRAYYREEVLKHLVASKLDFHIYGGGQERIKAVNTVFHQPVSYIESTDIFDDAKIILNIMPCFKSGTHDRIASAMLHKAVALTDHSAYLDELPTNIMCFYDINDVRILPELIKGILSDVHKDQNIADNGYRFAKNNWSWEITVNKLLEIMET